MKEISFFATEVEYNEVIGGEVVQTKKQRERFPLNIMEKQINR